MKSLSQELAKILVETKFEDLPEDVVHEAKRSILDSIGCAIAGITGDKGKISVELARRLGGPPESSIIGIGDKVSCWSAAFANGELVNALDYDPVSHIQPFVIPPPLAMAESAKASGRDLIIATVLALEISKRLLFGLSSTKGYATLMAGLIKDGKTPPVFGNGQYCIFGAAAGSGKILKLDHKEMIHVLGIAGHICPVPTGKKWGETAPMPMTKYAPAGWLCSAAVTAALIAKMGYVGDTTVFDGEYGFWRFFGSEGWYPDVVMDKIGKTWLFTDIHYKLYPCCSFLHSQLDCFTSIIEQNNLVPEDIDSVKAYGFPYFASRLPTEVTNQIDAQFNPLYLFAVAAHRVKIGADWQDWNTISNPKIKEFMKKVSYQVHPGAVEAKRKDPRSWLAKVEVVAKEKKFEEERIYAKGTSFTDFKATDEELVEKFRGNVSKILTKDKIDKAVKSLLELEKVEDISEFMRLVTI